MAVDKHRTRQMDLLPATTISGGVRDTYGSSVFIGRAVIQNRTETPEFRKEEMVLNINHVLMALSLTLIRNSSPAPPSKDFRSPMYRSRRFSYARCEYSTHVHTQGANV